MKEIIEANWKTIMEQVRDDNDISDIIMDTWVSTLRIFDVAGKIVYLYSEKKRGKHGVKYLKDHGYDRCLLSSIRKVLKDPSIDIVIVDYDTYKTSCVQEPIVEDPALPVVAQPASTPDAPKKSTAVATKRKKKKKKYSLGKVYKYNIRKSNKLAISSGFDYTLLELKIENYIITLLKTEKIKQIDEQGNENMADIPVKEYQIDFNDICVQTGMSICGRSFNYIEEALKALRDKSILVEFENGHRQPVSFLASYDRKSGEAKATVLVHPQILPIIMDRTGNFLNYSGKYTMLMDGKYGIRIYEWLKARLEKEVYRQKISIRKAREIKLDKATSEQEFEEIKQFYAQQELDAIKRAYVFSYKRKELIDNFYLPDSYKKRISAIETKVFETAKNFINQQSDIYIIKYEYNEETDAFDVYCRNEDSAVLTVKDLMLEEDLNDKQKKLTSDEKAQKESSKKKLTELQQNIHQMTLSQLDPQFRLDNA